jgi:hypothetical protein
VTYTDDFGEQRTVQAVGWAHVERERPADTEQPADTSMTDQALAFIGALLGLNG